MERKGKMIIILAATASVMILVNFYMLKRAIKIGTEATNLSYKQSKEEVKEEVYQEYYDSSYDYAEKKNHVSDVVAIEIGEIQEQAKLEVLEVSNVAYVIEDASENEENITSWLEVTGTGTFTVDLTLSEFLVDNERHSVIVRIPEPKLTNFRLDAPKQLKWENDILNDSIKKGEELARKDLIKGEQLLKAEFNTSQLFFSNARNSAESLIENLVKDLNPSVPDLTVEVEFME